MEIREIVSLLEGRIEALVPELLPAGHRAGHEWVEAGLALGGLGSSLTVHMTGAKAGVWAHYAAGPGVAGDLLDLIAYLKFGGNKGNALRWARRWLCIDHMDAAELEQTRRQAATRTAAAGAAQMRDKEKRGRHAAALWLSGAPKIAGTPAEAYLIGRGIDLRALGRQPGVLRYHPKLYAKVDERRHPALLAVVTGADGNICAVHRTYLAVNRLGSVTKAAMENPKMVLGPYAGGAIRLWRGTRVDPKTGEVKPGWPLGRAEAGSSIVICEGIEDGLTLATQAPDRRIMAAISISNMASVALPETIAEVILVADNDAADSAAAAAFDKAVQAHMAAGRRVKVARAPEGYKDVNELLQSGDCIERRDGAGVEDAGEPASRGGAR